MFTVLFFCDSLDCKSAVCRKPVFPGLPKPVLRPHDSPPLISAAGQPRGRL
jgi:hypothetical protein